MTWQNEAKSDKEIKCSSLHTSPSRSLRAGHDTSPGATSSRTTPDLCTRARGASSLRPTMAPDRGRSSNDRLGKRHEDSRYGRRRLHRKLRVQAARELGFVPIVLDNLSKGNRWAVKWGPFQ